MPLNENLVSTHFHLVIKHCEITVLRQINYELLQEDYYHT